MTKAQDYRDFSLESFKFIAGLTNIRPDFEQFDFKYFIDARSLPP